MNDKTVKQQIQIALVSRNMKLIDLYKKLKEKNNKIYCYQNLVKKINQNTLRYDEVQEIANILKFEIIWKDNNEKQND